jgi:hypothetical protein
MIDESQQDTVAIKACGACASPLLATDKFCRRCGVSRFDCAPVSTYATTALATERRVEVYHRISAPLVSAVLTGTLVGTSTSDQNRLPKRLILTLISIPVWLIIILLSPLDAYAAVKNLTRQM